MLIKICNNLNYFLYLKNLVPMLNNLFPVLTSLFSFRSVDIHLTIWMSISLFFSNQQCSFTTFLRPTVTGAVTLWLHILRNMARWTLFLFFKLINCFICYYMQYHHISYCVRILILKKYSPKCRHQNVLK